MSSSACVLVIASTVNVSVCALGAVRSAGEDDGGRLDLPAKDEQPSAKASSRGAECSALLALLAGYEESVHSIVWGHVSYQASPSGTWAHLESSEAGWEESGRWFVGAEFLTYVKDERGVVSQRTYAFVDQSGERMLAIDLGTFGGKAANPHSALWISTSPLHFMGRVVDVSGHRGPAELLDGAADLAFVPATAETPDPGLRGTVGLAQSALVLEVHLDPRRGGMPTRIIASATTGQPLVAYQVISSRLVDGIAMSACGLRVTYSSAPASETDEEQLRRLREQLASCRELRGVPPIDGEMRIAISAAVERLAVVGRGGQSGELVYAPLGCFEPYGQIQPELCFMNVRSVNSGLPKERLSLPAPSTALVYDFFRNKRIPWTDALKELDLVTAATSSSK